MTNEFKVENKVQEALFVCELLGQFSDGYWENHVHHGRHDHWRIWGQAEVSVAETPEEVGRNFTDWNIKDNYNLNSKELLEYIGDRMVLYARLALAGFTITEIRHLEYAFTNSHKDENGKLVWDRTSGPTHTGEYWDKIRATIMCYDTDVANSLNVVAANTSFDMKELKHELFLLKKVMKKYSS